MIGTIIVILIILWLLGFSLGLIGSFIHILLVIAIILILLRIIQGRKPQPNKMKHTKDRFNSQKRITMRKYCMQTVSTDGHIKFLKKGSYRIFLENADLCLLPGGTYHPEDLIAGTTRKNWESRKSISLDEEDLNEGDHQKLAQYKRSCHRRLRRISGSKSK